MQARIKDAPRGVTINLRADGRRRALIDRAAQTLGKNRSEFMLDAACREATAVLLDARFFMLDAKTFKQFSAALDNAPTDNPRLRRLLATKAPWDSMSKGRGDIGAPEHLDKDHDLSAFDSGVPALDDWLRKRALANEESGASRTYVVRADGRVVGYYALASGAIARQGATGRVRRNMPDAIPVMVVGRLAVDRAFQGRGLGAGLLRDAVLRTLQAAAIGGIRALLLHAISDDAKRFYARWGFAESPLDPMTMMIAIADAEAVLARAV